MDLIKRCLTSETRSIEKARALCRELAQSHYENFSVVSLFLPKKLRQHFYNVYENLCTLGNHRKHILYTVSFEQKIKSQFHKNH